MKIRGANPGDFAAIQEMAAVVFADYGDYGRIIPDWLAHDGVLTSVGEEEERLVGFSMVGFYRIDPTTVLYAADLLAIAVAPDAQGRGVGRQLLKHTIAKAEAARRRLPVRELRLSVAEPNLRALKLFRAAGFIELPGEHGRYDGGQRALHMARLL